MSRWPGHAAWPRAAVSGAEPAPRDGARSRLRSRVAARACPPPAAGGGRIARGAARRAGAAQRLAVRPSPDVLVVAPARPRSRAACRATARGAPDRATAAPQQLSATSAHARTAVPWTATRRAAGPMPRRRRPRASDARAHAADRHGRRPRRRRNARGVGALAPEGSRGRAGPHEDAAPAPTPRRQVPGPATAAETLRGAVAAADPRRGGRARAGSPSSTRPVADDGACRPRTARPPTTRPSAGSPAMPAMPRPDGRCRTYAATTTRRRRPGLLPEAAASCCAAWASTAGSTTTSCDPRAGRRPSSGVEPR